MKLARTFEGIYRFSNEKLGWFYNDEYIYITKKGEFRTGVYARNFSAGIRDYQMIGSKEEMTEAILQELINADLSNNNVSR